jgi:hypothetical protein
VEVDTVVTVRAQRRIQTKGSEVVRGAVLPSAGIGAFPSVYDIRYVDLQEWVGVAALDEGLRDFLAVSRIAVKRIG